MTKKIAISLPDETFEAVERLRRRTGESRSAVIARSVRALSDAEAKRRLAADYVEAYRRVPESAEDVASARAVAAKVLRALPWDDE